MRPVYIPHVDFDVDLESLLRDIPWSRHTETRSECFMSPEPYTYTYGKGSGQRSYDSIPISVSIASTMQKVNEILDRDLSFGPMTGCFLNRYDHDREHLGWHSDDFPGMDHTRPIVSVSFGEPREIWCRLIGTSGEVSEGNRLLLADSSMFVMPPGFQSTHQHRIPKGSRKMGPRVSLTFRAFK